MGFIFCALNLRPPETRDPSHRRYAGRIYLRTNTVGDMEPTLA
jgi:hypothetical protein